jgi:hypothetical protein
VTFDNWERWCKAEGILESDHSVFEYANWLFSVEVRSRIFNAREFHTVTNFPAQYVLVVTEVIGQDRANDVSHIALVQERTEAEPIIRSLVKDARVFHEHALALAGAYAIREGLDDVLWSKDLTYAWI